MRDCSRDSSPSGHAPRFDDGISLTCYDELADDLMSMQMRGWMGNR